MVYEGEVPHTYLWDRPDKWLNDLHMANLLQALLVRQTAKDHPNMKLFVNYPLPPKELAALAERKRLDVFNKFMKFSGRAAYILPICVGITHWVLLFMWRESDRGAVRGFYFDSTGDPPTNESLCRLIIYMEVSGATINTTTRLAVQDFDVDSVHCGIWTYVYAKALADYVGRDRTSRSFNAGFLRSCFNRGLNVNSNTRTSSAQNVKFAATLRGTLEQQFATLVESGRNVTIYRTDRSYRPPAVVEPYRGEIIDISSNDEDEVPQYKDDDNLKLAQALSLSVSAEKAGTDSVRFEEETRVARALSLNDAATAASEAAARERCEAAAKRLEAFLAPRGSVPATGPCFDVSLLLLKTGWVRAVGELGKSLVATRQKVHLEMINHYWGNSDADVDARDHAEGLLRVTKKEDGTEEPTVSLREPALHYMALEHKLRVAIVDVEGRFQGVTGLPANSGQHVEAAGQRVEVVWVLWDPEGRGHYEPLLGQAYTPGQRIVPAQLTLDGVDLDVTETTLERWDRLLSDRPVAAVPSPPASLGASVASGSVEQGHGGLAPAHSSGELEGDGSDGSEDAGCQWPHQGNCPFCSDGITRRFEPLCHHYDAVRRGLSAGRSIDICQDSQVSFAASLTQNSFMKMFDIAMREQLFEPTRGVGFYDAGHGTARALRCGALLATAAGYRSGGSPVYHGSELDRDQFDRSVTAVDWLPEDPQVRIHIQHGDLMELDVPSNAGFVYWFKCLKEQQESDWLVKLLRSEQVRGFACAINPTRVTALLSKQQPRDIKELPKFEKVATFTGSMTNKGGTRLFTVYRVQRVSVTSNSPKRRLSFAGERSSDGSPGAGDASPRRPHRHLKQSHTRVSRSRRRQAPPKHPQSSPNKTKKKLARRGNDDIAVRPREQAGTLVWSETGEPRRRESLSPNFRLPPPNEKLRRVIRGKAKKRKKKRKVRCRKCMECKVCGEHRGGYHKALSQTANDKKRREQRHFRDHVKPLIQHAFPPGSVDFFEFFSSACAQELSPELHEAACAAKALGKMDPQKAPGKMDPHASGSDLTTSASATTPREGADPIPDFDKLDGIGKVNKKKLYQKYPFITRLLSTTRDIFDKRIGKAYKTSFGSLIGRLLSQKEHKEVLGDDIGETVKECRKSKTLAKAKEKLEVNYTPGTTRDSRVHRIETECTREFMATQLGNRSGQTEEGYYRYHSRDHVYWNMYYRNFAKVCKLIAQPVESAGEETQASFVGGKGQPKTRTQRNFCNYRKYGDRCKVATPRNTPRLDGELQDDHDLEWQYADRLIPLSYEAFWTAIERKGGEGLRIKHVKQIAGSCPHCSQLEALEAEYLKLQGESEVDKKKLAAVWYKLVQARLHRQFWTHQRPFSQYLKAWMVENKEKEEVQTTCLVYQDYGKFYASDGSKVKDLCLVICYLEDGELRYKYVDNLFKGGSDSSHTIAIWTRLMDETELFDRFKTIYLCGDTGNGFRGYDVAAFLSTWGEKWDKRVVQCFLCPRHAYSLCDAHFGHLYEIIHTQKILGWLISEEDYQAAIDASIETGVIKNTETFVWTDFQESTSPTNVSRGQYISGVTHLEYPDGPGWALVRTVSGSGPWRLMKLFKDIKWKHDYCKKCSLASHWPVQAHTAEAQCPYSKKGVSKSQGDPRELEDAVKWYPVHQDGQVVKNHVAALKKRLDVFRVESLDDVDPNNGSFFVVNNGQVSPHPTWSVVKFLERRARDGNVQVHWYGHTKNPKTDKHRLKKQVKLYVCVCVCVRACAIL